MPSPVNGPGSATESWGQQKKQTAESPPASEPVPSEPDGGSTSASSGSTEAAAAAGTTAGAASASASAPATSVAPIPERLRDLIALHSRSDAPALTELHTLARRLDESQQWTAEIGLAPAAVQRTAAEIIAQASESIRAQATQTRDGVRALLSLEG